ncbi:DUF7344 domain-containing protein [Haladaptatus caseinilyticus]|uniref:DUF7344 domain-containing protein n=1 Tax=Haladaptatus caseinilyticus TaxID=2993314 RepID=UPI00224A6A86|nr:hypothetical protein [Haladaptatus caseinilyticus]
MSAAEAQIDTSESHDADGKKANPELSKDKIFHLLQTPRRRYVLRYLQEYDGTVQMRDIAEQVAAWENNTTLQELTSDQRQRVYIPLYQSHLPKLDEEGIIQYDQSRGTVKRTEVADQFDQFLLIDESAKIETQVENQIRWETYYLGVSVVSTILLVASAFGPSIVETIPSGIVGGIIVAMFAIITLAQFVTEYDEN